MRQNVKIAVIAFGALATSAAIAKERTDGRPATYSAGDKNHCVSLVFNGGQPSYVELLVCLETSLYARGIAQERLADQTSTSSMTPLKPSRATRRTGTEAHVSPPRGTRPSCGSGRNFAVA